MKRSIWINAFKFSIFLSLLFQGNLEAAQPPSDIYLINIPTQFTTPCSIEGEETGLHQQYYDTGELYLATNCLEGKKEGVEQTYYENGQLWIERSYIQNKLEGSFTFYYPEGYIHKEFLYHLGKKQGIQKTYDKQGRIYREEEYVFGMRNGFNREFNHDGNVLEEKMYKNSKVMNVQYATNLPIEGNQQVRPSLYEQIKEEVESGLLEASQSQNIQNKYPNQDIFISSPEKAIDKGMVAMEYWGE